MNLVNLIRNLRAISNWIKLKEKAPILSAEICCKIKLFLKYFQDYGRITYREIKIFKIVDKTAEQRIWAIGQSSLKTKTICKRK